MFVSAFLYEVFSFVGQTLPTVDLGFKGKGDDGKNTV